MPTIVTASQLNLHFVDVGFGQLGTIEHVTGHHSATPPDGSRTEAIAYVRRFHREHKKKGWGGLGYHFVIGRDGTIYGGRPIVMKGAHVGGENTGNLGVMFIGTVGTRPTVRQMRSYRWLLRNAHTRKLPAAHRAPRSLQDDRRGWAKVKGHNDWPAHRSNACPGTHKTMIKTRGRRR